MSDEQFDGEVTISATPSGPARIRLNGNIAQVGVGGNGHAGDACFGAVPGKEIAASGQSAGW